MSSKRAVKVIERIEELGVTRKALANSAGVTERAVYRWLSYESEPKLTSEQFAAICNLLQWTIQDLATAYYPPESSIPVEPVSDGDSSPK